MENETPASNETRMKNNNNADLNNNNQTGSGFTLGMKSNKTIDSVASEAIPHSFEESPGVIEYDGPLSIGPVLQSRGGKLPGSEKPLQLTAGERVYPQMDSEQSLSASALVAARGIVQYGVGQVDIDEKIGTVLKVSFHMNLTG